MPNIKIEGDVRKRVIQGGKWVTAGKLSRSVFGLMINAFLARLLSPDDLGVYFLLLSIATLLALLAGLGMDVAVVRTASELLTKNKEGLIWSLLKKSYIISLAGIISVGTIYLTVGWQLTNYIFDSKQFGSIVWLSIIWLSLLTIQKILAETFRGLHKINIATLLDGVISTSINFLLFLLAWSLIVEIELEKAVMLTLFSLFVAIFFGSLYLLMILKHTPSTGTINIAHLWHIGWPQMISTIALFNLSQAAILLVGSFLGTAHVAIYVMALKLMIIIRLPQFIVNSVLPPIIAELNTQGNHKKLERLLHATATLATLLSSIVALTYIFWGDILLGFIYGSEYSQGHSILIILALGQIINVSVGSCGQVLSMTGHQQYLMRLSIITITLSISLALLLVNIYGSEGIALAFTLGVIFQSLTALYITRKKVGIWTYANLSPNGLLELKRYIKNR